MIDYAELIPSKDVREYSYENGKQKVHILTVKDELTTLKEADESNNKESLYANNFDHFTYSPELSSFTRVSYKAVDAVNKYCNGDADYYRKHISDHLPIVMTIEI